MSSRHGTPIWYELMTRDPQAARRFYSRVVGWTIDETPPPGSTMEYRMVSAPDGHVGGMFTLTDEHVAGGARPGWLMYLGVDDVDACVASVSAGGGRVLMPAWDIPQVGRIAMVSDPQGAPFYVMRGASDEESTACDPLRAGHGAWHELHAKDGPSATAFYVQQFQWKKAQAMDMGAAGVYQLIDIGERQLGGIMSDPAWPTPGWLLYFRADGIEALAARVTEAGGTVVLPPMEVPGGGWILNARDPEGGLFGLTGTR